MAEKFVVDESLMNAFRAAVAEQQRDALALELALAKRSQAELLEQQVAARKAELDARLQTLKSRIDSAVLENGQYEALSSLAMNGEVLRRKKES